MPSIRKHLVLKAAYRFSQEPKWIENRTIIENQQLQYQKNYRTQIQKSLKKDHSPETCKNVAENKY